MGKIVIMGGGTFNHVRNHLALAAPAFGTTAIELANMLYSTKFHGHQVVLELTKMADRRSSLVTNDDVARRLDEHIADPGVRAIIFNVALCDYDGKVGDTVESGSHAERLKTSKGVTSMTLTPAEKLIGRIRKHRKDIFVVGFKTTTSASPDESYAQALRLLKTNSVNLVLANDTVARRNMIVVPEESRYDFGQDRKLALSKLLDFTLARMENTFTRSKVISGELVPWHSKTIPDNLRKVVDHCRERGAYKPVMGKTAGHFAVKIDSTSLLTSVRKSNFNDLDKPGNGLVMVASDGPDDVLAYGAKPSVGGQSQRIIFAEHQDAECIVHFHCPMNVTRPLEVPIRQQWPYECGSHQCGSNTSEGLLEFNLGGGDKLKAVYLAEHGPNIVFSRNTDPDKVIEFIETHFVLPAKTGGLAAMDA